MKRVHVFAIEWLPSLDDVASGGGLRSLQIVEALRAGGYDVTVSVPHNSNRIKALQGSDPGRLRGMLFHDHRDHLDLLRQLRPDVVVWLWPSLRSFPFDPAAVNVCDLNGLQHFEMANGITEMVVPAREQLIKRCVGADLVLTGSVEQNGFWAAELARAGADVPTAVVPYALPASLHLPAASTAAPLRRLHFVGNLYSWNRAITWLARVADWCGCNEGVGLEIAAGLDPGGATDLGAIQALRRIEARPGVRSRGEVALRAILEAYQPGSVSLDLYDDTLERRLAVPIRTVNALTQGVPVLTNVESTLTRGLARANAAVITGTGLGGGGDALNAALDHLAQLPPESLAAMSAAAASFARSRFDEAPARDALLGGLDRAVHAREGKRVSWLLTKPKRSEQPHVLVLTDQHTNMRDVRINVPLGALHREGRIAGYSVWSKGAIDFSTRTAEPDPAFDAIWVQRELTPETTLALGALNRPYLLDLDDNLLVSPAYRDRFSPEQMQAARSLVRGCAALTTSNDRLAGLLQHYAHTTLLDRTFTCRNLAAELPPKVPAGAPNCIVWASSDTPALTGSYLEIVRAIRDFCVAHALRLVCIGARPPALLQEAGIEIEHIGLIPHPAYLAQLRSLTPAILVAPLETSADPTTQDFINGKSDVKVLEAIATGLVGVFSDARPYRDTDLPSPILCRNEYSAWFKALDQARQTCLQGGPYPELPIARLAAGAGLRSWSDAVARVRLRYPLRLSELRAAIALTRSRLQRRLLPEEEFDPEWYVAMNEDVRGAVASGAITAYGHYLSNGFFEKRLGNADDHANPSADEFWNNLQHTISDVRHAIEERTKHLDAIQMRRRMRRG